MLKKNNFFLSPFLCFVFFCFVVLSFVSIVCVCVCVCACVRVCMGMVRSGWGGKSIQTTGAEVESHLPFGRGRQNQLVPTILPTPAFPFSIVRLVSDGSHCAGAMITQFQRSRVKEPCPGN